MSSSSPASSVFPSSSPASAPPAVPSAPSAPDTSGTGSSALPALVERLRSAGCVFAEDEARLLLDAARTAAELTAMTDRRAAGLPLEHVLGWAEFRGLRIAVDPGVFVPRRRTEFLVERAAALAGPGTVVVDLCCGSGALGLAVAAADGIELHASDIDPAAVRCARRNIAGVGRVYEGDLCAPLPAALRGRVGILLANVPYVPTGDVGLLPAEARDHEARVALDGGEDGLDVLRRVSAAAPHWLAPGGHLLFETSDHQVDRAVATVRADGLVARLATCDERDAHVVIASRPDGPGADAGLSPAARGRARRPPYGPRP